MLFTYEWARGLGEISRWCQPPGLNKGVSPLRQERRNHPQTIWETRRECSDPPPLTGRVDGIADGPVVVTTG